MKIQELIAKAAELNSALIKDSESWDGWIAIYGQNGVSLYDEFWQEKATNPRWLRPLTKDLYITSNGKNNDIRDIETKEVVYPSVERPLYFGHIGGVEYYGFCRGRKYSFFNPKRELLLETEHEGEFKAQKNGTYVIETENGDWSLHREDKSVICTGEHDDSLSVYYKGKHKNFIAILHGEKDRTLLKPDGTFIVRGYVKTVDNGFAVFKNGMLFIIDFDVAGTDALRELEANKDKFTAEYCEEYKQILTNLGPGLLVEDWMVGFYS